MRRFIPLSALGLAVAFVGCTESDITRPASPSTSELGAAATAVMVTLGRDIFFDQTLSANGNQACASCHDPSVGWTGPLTEVNAAGAVYEGSIDGRFGNRKPPSSAYATFSPVLYYDGDTFVGGNFWDGRATGERLGSPAAEQALGPFLNPMEQALAEPAEVVEQICAGSYADDAAAAWPSTYCTDTDEGTILAAYDAVGLAVAAFEASAESNAFTSKYDQSLHGGAVKLTKEERRGQALFQGKGKCARCHPLGRGQEPALFTDFTFDNLGVPVNPENPQYLATGALDPGLGGFLATRADYEDLAAENMGKHKVPTLRNVDLRPDADFVKAYAHNGYFKSLWQIVHFYNTRDVKPTCPDAYPAAQAIAADCWPAPEIGENVNRDELGDLGLSFEDEMAIVAFLKTLSDGYGK
jgi:cytochrome c peroxidase